MDTNFIKLMDSKRRELKLSIEELGNRAGVNKSTVSRMLNGGDTRLSVITKICKVLGLEIAISVPAASSDLSKEKLAKAIDLLEQMASQKGIKFSAEEKAEFYINYSASENKGTIMLDSDEAAELE